MESLETTLLYKAYDLGAKAALVVCLLPLLVILALSFRENTLLAASVKYALERPTFAFLLLNCLIVTIMARSKFEYAKGGHEAKSKDKRVEQVNRKGNEIGNVHDQEKVGEGKSHIPLMVNNNGYDSLGNSVENYYDKDIASFHRDQQGQEKKNKREPEIESTVKGDDDVKNVTEQCHTDISQKNGHDCCSKNKVKSFLKKSWSLNATLDNKNRNVKFRYGNEKKAIRRARLIAGRRNGKVGLHSHKPPRSDLKENQLLSSNLVSFHAADSAGFHREKPNLPRIAFDQTADQQHTKWCGRSKNFSDHRPRQAQNPAPVQEVAAHPSMDEVWAAIMSSNKAHNCITSCTHAQKRSGEPSSRIAKQPEAAAALSTPIQPAVAVLAPSPAADPHYMCQPPAAAASSSNRAAAAPIPKPKPAEKTLPATAGNFKKDSKIERNERDVKELNRRAEQFITRFNCQMRLQREESLQRGQKPRGHRPCTYAHTPFPRPMQEGGLLVG